jgi:RNA polymerase sigma-70 factor (ECF subfamily)
MVNQQQRLLSETEIIEKILNGDLQLFEILIRRNNEVLYKIARSFGFNHQDAEDIMQDVHVTAYTSLKSFEGRSSYKTWISKIMVNKCLYKINHGYYSKEIPTGEIMEPSNSNPMSAHINPEQTAINSELAGVLEKSSKDTSHLQNSLCTKTGTGIFGSGNCRDPWNFAYQCKSEAKQGQGIITKRTGEGL